MYSVLQLIYRNQATFPLFGGHFIHILLLKPLFVTNEEEEKYIYIQTDFLCILFHMLYVITLSVDWCWPCNIITHIWPSSYCCQYVTYLSVDWSFGPAACITNTHMRQLQRLIKKQLARLGEIFLAYIYFMCPFLLYILYI